MKTKQANPAPALGRDDFETAAAYCYAVAVKCLADLGQVPSLLFAGRKIGAALQMAFVDDVALKNAEDKRRLSLIMEGLVQSAGVDVVVHISEAWTLVRPAEQGMPEGSLADQPDRQEAVIFNIRSKDCQAMVNNPLRRNPDRIEPAPVDFGQEIIGGHLARKNPVKH